MKKLFLVLLFLAVSLFAKIDINSADAKTLASIKGVGDKKAEAIVDYREKNGKFTNIDDVVKVKGVGNKLLEIIKQEAEVK
ncbi:MAG: helix-hairpin-helix domain-containing protein [Campylobacteraceae bacterium]|jgi:competence protein ComEA|nr:helix-hairpin-helix domain-containing protein [Campylobacteraceae bacterium]